MIKINLITKDVSGIPWGFELNLHLPKIAIFKKTNTRFQGVHIELGLYAPTVFAVDFSENKCYYQNIVFGFGFTIHFYRNKGVIDDATKVIY